MPVLLAASAIASYWSKYFFFDWRSVVLESVVSL